MIFKKLKKNLTLFLGLGMSTILATSIGLFATACTTSQSTDTSNTIYARDNTTITDSGGLTTVEYSQEKWIGDNSVSIAMVSQPNTSYLTSTLSSYLETNVNDKTSSDSVKYNSYTLVYNLNEAIKLGAGGYSISTITAGTGWLLDYSIDSSNNDLVTYYLATNMHVLNATFTVTYQQVFTNNTTGQGTQYTVSATFPISSKTVSSLSVYLSQPQYSTSSANNNLKIPLSSVENLNNAWYKTPITISDFNSSLIPLGAYNSSGTPSSNSSSYNMEISFYPTGFSNYAQTYYFSSDGSSGSSSTTNGTPAASDFSVLKFKASKSAFNALSTTGTYGSVFSKIKEMFKVNTDDETTAKDSSYIARLNKLLTLTSNESTYDKATASELFMFADYNKDLNSKTILSTAGFPATSSGSYNYINFNSNTISYSLATNTPSSSYSARTSIEYNQNGEFYYSTYNWSYNLLMKNINLLSGSSGSMTVDQDYKITGIYWGTLTSQGISNGQLTQIVNGVTTRLYSYSDSSSMINIWLKYVAANDENSKLAQLFTNLKKLNYFS